MDLIGFLEDTNLDNPNLAKYKDWNTRLAVRCILERKDRKIAIMHIAKYDIYKLPGGGVDLGEDLTAAFKREIKEETGCTAEIIDDLGVFIEKRDGWTMVQVSFCYYAKVLKHGTPELIKSEIEEGFSLKWEKPLDALELIQNSKSEVYDNKFMVARDAQILKDGIDQLKLN